MEKRFGEGNVEFRYNWRKMEEAAHDRAGWN